MIERPIRLGDNALAFELWFWMRVSRPLELVTVESDLRFFVDRRCREQNVSIAFPQRDVHLDTLSPLKVEVMGR
ncbi:MAG: hypothetical protein AAGK78_10370 [Planctomycetota bacterium]